jgi:hypothetical protein
MPTGHLVYLADDLRTHSVKGSNNWFNRRCAKPGSVIISAPTSAQARAPRCAEPGAPQHQLMALFEARNSNKISPLVPTL